MTKRSLSPRPTNAAAPAPSPRGETIAALLADYRTSRLAKACGVELSTVSRWRAGAVPDERHLPALAAFTRLSEARLRKALIRTIAASI